MASVIGEFDLNWPQKLGDVFVHLFSPLDFDVDIVDLKCIWTSWGWRHNFLFQMMLVPMIALYSYYKYCGAALILKLKARGGSQLPKVLGLFFEEVQNETALKEMGLAMISTIVTFTNIIYITLCR